MPENIKLYDRDYVDVLLETSDRDVASDFLRKSGKGWLPMTISYGPHWQQRWGGRLEITVDGEVTTTDHYELLQYLVLWPDNPWEVS